MKILVSELPKSDWWGKGMPAYAHNWLMSQGNIPRPDVVRDAHKRFLSELQKITDVIVLPFPEKFDVDHLYKHDFIFVRDSYIHAGGKHVIISNFSERGRQDEAEYMEMYLTSLGCTVHKLSPDAQAEGGEFYMLPKDNLLFAGVTRNNKKGVEEVSRIANIENVCIVKNPAFHLDTNFTVLVDSHDHCVGVVGCFSVIENRQEVEAFCKKHSLECIHVNPVDGIGTPEEPGSFAANSQAFPGVIIGCAHFETPGVEERIHSMGIRHIVVPLYDLKFSGGSFHCLTNELELG
jgi:N-dimethylarginine dimethylaminohydrolase